MSTQFETTPDDLTDTVKSQLVAFARHEGVDAQYRSGSKIQDRFKDQTILDRIIFKDGMIQNPATVTAFVYDSAEVPGFLMRNQDKISEPAVDVERDTKTGENTRRDDPYLAFEFPDGNKSAIDPDLLEVVEAVYGFDPEEHPERVLGNPDSYQWPVMVADDDAATHIIVAPIVINREDWR